MKRDQLIRDLRKDARKAGGELIVDTARGKGGHYVLRSEANFGDPARRDHSEDGADNPKAARPLNLYRTARGAMMEFFYRMERDGAGWLVTFRSLPEAITGGATEEEAVKNAIDAVEVTLLTYAKDGREIPPSDKKRHDDESGSVVLSAFLAAKIAFIEAFRKSGVSRVALASKLGKNESEVRRMLDPYHHTKLETLETAMRILGKRFVISVQDEPTVGKAA